MMTWVSQIFQKYCCFYTKIARKCIALYTHLTPKTMQNMVFVVFCSICIVFKPLNTYCLRQNWTKLIFREKKLHNSSPWYQISGVTHLTINHLDKDTEITLQYIISSSSTAWNFIKASTSYCIWLSLLPERFPTLNLHI